MIISINTDEIRSISSLASRVSAEIHDACNGLSSLTTHDDWSCAERDYLNDVILSIKQCGRALDECAESFSAALNTAAAEFEEFEKSDPKSVLGLQVCINDGLAMDPSRVVGMKLNGVFSDVVENIEKDNNLSGLSGYQLHVLNMPISVIPFGELNSDK